MGRDPRSPARVQLDADPGKIARVTNIGHAQPVLEAQAPTGNLTKKKKEERKRKKKKRKRNDDVDQPGAAIRALAPRVLITWPPRLGEIVKVAGTKRCQGHFQSASVDLGLPADQQSSSLSAKIALYSRLGHSRGLPNNGPCGAGPAEACESFPPFLLPPIAGSNRV